MANPMKRWGRAAIGASLLAITPVCSAIDNPDAPDWLGTFEASNATFEQRIYRTAKDQDEIDRAYAEYLEFLDRSLNQAYDHLNDRLDRHQQNALRRSQRLWLQFRDAESDFIDQNWTITNFGSSSLISRKAYRAQLIKDRVLELLQYLTNYPASAGD